MNRHIKNHIPIAMAKRSMDAVVLEGIFFLVYRYHYELLLCRTPVAKLEFFRASGHQRMVKMLSWFEMREPEHGLAR